MITLTRHGPNFPPRETPAPGVVAPAAEGGAVNAATRAAARSVEAPLSRGQKTALVLLAHEAWERVRVTDPDTPDEESWRHAAAVTACGHRISEAQVQHFSMLKRHFLDLAGKAGRAFQSAMRESTEAERIAAAVLASECAARGLPLDYPAAIARRQFKRPLKDLTARQIWCLVFTVRNRREAPKSGQKSRPYTLRPTAAANAPF